MLTNMMIYILNGFTMCKSNDCHIFNFIKMFPLFGH